jgi:predicted  nucleic acid-binding Zn-ribbon protein
MSPLLSALVALQQLDTAADAARRRLGEMPAAEQDLDARVATARAAVDAVKARMPENQSARRELEKEVAQIDTRLARFEDHKAAVKTNQEFTALLHEIATAKAEKDVFEEQILLLLEAADVINADLAATETTLADTVREADEARAGLAAERAALQRELDRLAGERVVRTADIEPPVLAKYDQLLKQRRMVAVATISGEICAACHVRLRPAVAQQVRRNDGIIQCDSCHRILYYAPQDGAA